MENKKKLILHNETIKFLNDKQPASVVEGVAPRYATQNITCDTSSSTCAKQCC